MGAHDELRRLGLFDARAPRYTSYPPANHFSDAVGAVQTAEWMRDVPTGSRISLYLHIPYCRRLCWFCACRTQGTRTDRPLRPYLERLKAELALLDRHLPDDVRISRIHLGGGTPTLLPPELLTDLGALLRGLRPWTPDAALSAEIDPTEVDEARIAALRAIGMRRASIGVQDFDPQVQAAIGRAQGFERTRVVTEWLRAAGVTSLNFDVLYGLPHQSRRRMTDTIQRVLALAPDRVALYGYAHVPWMAKRQVMIPSEALPGAEARLELFETARRLFLWDGYREIGIDHFARQGDSLAEADRARVLRRNFQGYTDDPSDVLIGLGASAISRYPQGYAQNAATSSDYAKAVDAGRLATVRGHAFTATDRLRGAVIESLMCRFEVDRAEIRARCGCGGAEIDAVLAPLEETFADWIERRGEILRLCRTPRYVARLAAQAVDAHAMPEGRHSRAL